MPQDDYNYGKALVKTSLSRRAGAARRAAGRPTFLDTPRCARPVNLTRTRLSESRKQPAKIPERQPREQGATGRNAGSIILAGSGIARSMDSAAREQLAARRTRCASAAVRERHGSRDQGYVACRRRRSGVDQDHKAQWWWRAWPEPTCQCPRAHLSKSRS